MLVVIWRGWGFAVLCIIGCLQMAVCYALYGHMRLSLFEHGDPVTYWRTGIAGGAIVAIVGYFLNQFRRPKEERAFSKAKHTVFTVPVEYFGLFWMVLSLMQ